MYSNGVEQKSPMNPSLSLMRETSHLEQSLNLASLGVEVDIVETRSCRQPRHGRHGSNQGVDKAGTGRESDISNRQGEAGGDTLFAGIIREGKSSLGHTDG